MLRILARSWEPPVFTRVRKLGADGWVSGRDIVVGGKRGRGGVVGKVVEWGGPLSLSLSLLDVGAVVFCRLVGGKRVCS